MWLVGPVLALGNGHPYCRASFAVPIRQQEEGEWPWALLVDSVPEAAAASLLGLGAEP